MRHFALMAASPHSAGGGGPGALAAAFHTGVLKRMRAGLAHHPEAAALWRGHGDGVLPLAADARWWQPETGAVLRHMEEGAPLAAVIQALLSLHACGSGGRWRAALARPERFSLGGHCVDFDGEFEVEAAPSRIAFARAGLRPLVLAHDAGAWHLQGDAPADPGWRHGPPVHLRAPAPAGIYLQAWDGSAAGDAGIVIDWPRRQPPATAASLENAAAAFEQAFALLDAADPCYLPWITSLLRGICVTPMRENGVHNSGSAIWHAGIVACGFPVDAPLLAEAIVHETSHQYFHLLHSVMPLVRKEDGKEALYYSSLKRAHRPLFLVLLAFHATANMSLLWDDLQRRRPSARHAAELQASLAHTRSLAGHLHDHPQLSEQGATLYAAQAGLLRARGHEIAPASGYSRASTSTGATISAILTTDSGG